MEKIQSFETIDALMVATLATSLGPIQCVVLSFGSVDAKAGAGVINQTTKCLWTRDGRRITLSSKHGTFVGSTSKEIDPEWPLRPKAE